jgi:23S rRNA (adenine-N6)-dimethyltransferase
VSAATGTSRRAWGWHRLDHEWAARIVAQAAIRPGELVLDIGAGEGALTAPLIRGITARLLGLLLAPGSRLVAADLVLQRAVVRKHASRRTRGFQVSMGAAAPRRAFRPPPQVDSAVLVVRRR